MNVTELLQNLEAIRNTKIFFAGRVLAIRRGCPDGRARAKKVLSAPFWILEKWQYIHLSAVRNLLPFSVQKV